MSTPLHSSEPVDGDRKVTPVTFYVSALAVAVIDAATKYAAWALQPEPGASAVGGLLQFHLPSAGPMRNFSAGLRWHSPATFPPPI